MAAMRELSLRNAAASPLLRLSPELRNRIYELVFTVKLVHVEHGFKLTLAPSPICHGQNLHASRAARFFCFYQCKADVSEAEAYQRSQDAALEGQGFQDCHGPPSTTHPVNWTAGDNFHIDSCKERHRRCLYWPSFSQPNTRVLSSNRRIPLRALLSLSLLLVCRQVHTEAHTLPYSLNRFSFRQVSAFLAFISSAPAPQVHAIRHLALYMAAGHDNADESTCSHWNNHLLSVHLIRPFFSKTLPNLRTLHISISIAHHGTSADGPTRADVADPAKLDRWTIGLSRFRRLARDAVTVIVADDPDGKFGARGANRVLVHVANPHIHPVYGSWAAMREAQCLSAAEKRAWAERIRGKLVQEDDAAPGTRRIFVAEMDGPLGNLEERYV